MIPYKKGAGIVSKSVTVCKNECSAAENTCAQSVVRASFGQNWSAPAQAVLPCSSYEDCHKAQLNKHSKYKSAAEIGLFYLHSPKQNTNWRKL